MVTQLRAPSTARSHTLCAKCLVLVASVHVARVTRQRHVPVPACAWHHLDRTGQDRPRTCPPGASPSDGWVCKGPRHLFSRRVKDRGDPINKREKACAHVRACGRCVYTCEHGGDACTRVCVGDALAAYNLRGMTTNFILSIDFLSPGEKISHLC